MPQAQTNWMKRLLPIAVIVIGLGAAYAAGLHKYLSLEQLEAQRVTLKDFVASNLILAILAFLNWGYLQLQVAFF